MNKKVIEGILKEILNGTGHEDELDEVLGRAYGEQHGRRTDGTDLGMEVSITRKKGSENYVHRCFGDGTEIARAISSLVAEFCVTSANCLPEKDAADVLEDITDTAARLILGRLCDGED